MENSSGVGSGIPLCPPDIMDIIEDSWGQWEDDLVWEYMPVPKPLWGPHSDQAWIRFQDIQQEWQLGRAIYKDRPPIATLPLLEELTGT